MYDGEKRMTSPHKRQAHDNNTMHPNAISVVQRLEDEENVTQVIVFYM